MEKSIRVRVPQIVDLETAITVYYERLELRNADINRLFGPVGRARVVKLKDLARERMREEGVMPYDATSVNTSVAFKAWGLDIKDLEHRYDRLQRLLGKKLQHHGAS